MKKILLHAYTMNNLGDDLFIRVITDRYPDCVFYLPTLNSSYKKIFSDIKNLKVIDFMGISRLTSHKTYILPKLYSKIKMKSFDAAVCIGGSMFIDRKNPSDKDRKEAENYSFICDWEFAEKKNVPYYILGANWGPCYNDYFLNYFSRAFDSMADVCFRDSYSHNIFSDKKNVRHTGDILLGNEFIINSTCNISKKKQIAISVIDPERKTELKCDSTKYIKTIAKLSEAFASNGYSVVLMSFCRFEGDENAIGKILNMIDDKSNIKPLFYQHNWQEMLSAIAESEFMLATRFHATVLAWTLGTPAYSIIYSKKTQHLLDDCGITSYVEIENVDRLSFNLIISDSALPTKISFYSGAENTFSKLDKGRRDI